MPPQSGRCAPCPAARSAGPQEAAEDAAPVSVPGCRQGTVPIPPATGEESERAYQSARSSAREKLSKTDNNTERTRNPPPRKDGSNGPAFHEEKGNDLIDSVIDYFEQSTSGSVGGINLSQILKDVTSNTGASRAEVVQAIKDLLQSNILKKGVTEGTIILNSTSKTDEVEEDAEGPIPVINQETPETLRAKGWTETAPGIFVGPDGVQKYALTGESYNTKLNKHMSNFNDDNFSKLCEEFEKEFDKVDVSLDDSTEGLDEFADETEVSDEEGETMTMEIPRHLVDAITELAAIFSDSEDEPVDDLATDEEATIDLMDGDGDEAEVSIEETDEDEESAEGCEDDEEFNFDEDEETIADTAGSIFDASFGPNEGGASVTKASTTLPEKRRKPIEGAYRPNAGGQAYDASTRNGGASVTKATTTFNKSGKPITSKVSQKAKSKNSIFDL